MGIHLCALIHLWESSVHYLLIFRMFLYLLPGHCQKTIYLYSVHVGFLQPCMYQGHLGVIRRIWKVGQQLGKQ